MFEAKKLKKVISDCDQDFLGPCLGVGMLAIERHAFNARFRLTAVSAPPTPDTLPPRLTPVDDLPGYFARQGLRYFAVQEGVDQLPRQVRERLPRRFSSDLDSTDVDCLLHGRIRGKCRLMLMENFDPVVYATEAIPANSIVGLFAAKLIPAADLPAGVEDDRNSIWLTELEPCDVYKGPPLYFSAVEGGNIFRFLRHSQVHNHRRTPNVTVISVWFNGVPYMVVRALMPIPAGSELLYDWGDEFVSLLDLFDVHLASTVSHTLHKYLLALQDRFKVLRVPEPKWENSRPLWRLDVSASDTSVKMLTSEGNVYMFDAGAPEPNDEEPFRKTVRPQSTTSWQQWFAPVPQLRQMMKLKGIEYCVRQVVSDKARALMAKLSRKALPPRWQTQFSPTYHNRLQQLMFTTQLGMVEVRRMDLLSHHVRWASVPCVTQYGLVAVADLPRKFPLVAYKGRMCCGDEVRDQDRAETCMHYCSEAPGELDVVIDCELLGNEGRFVNDDRGSGKEPNATYVWTWDSQVQEMFLFVSTTRKIKAGEEILASYGDPFWSVGQTLLMNTHCKFWFQTIPRIRQLESYLTCLGLTVPPTPPLSSMDCARATKELFRCQERMYPERLLSMRVVEPYACFAESIVDIREHKGRGKECLVKFHGWDPSWNQWIEIELIDPALIEEYCGDSKRAKREARQRWNLEFSSLWKKRSAPIRPMKKQIRQAPLPADQREMTPSKRRAVAVVVKEERTTGDQFKGNLFLRDEMMATLPIL